MSSYRKKRGDDYTQGKQEIAVEERRRQWNIDLAQRTLESMYDRTQLDEDTIIDNKKRKIVNYNAQELYEKAKEYFENIMETNENGVPIIPDIEDFCMFAKISRFKFLNYRRSEDVDLSETANNIANAIANFKKQNAFQGLINPTIFAIDFNNNHDYVQAKTEITMNSNVTMQQIESNIADIANRIPMDDIPQIEESEG